MKVIVLISILFPLLALAKGGVEKKGAAERAVSSMSSVDGPATMREAFAFLRRLNEAGVVGRPSDLQNRKITMRIEQRGGGYYIFVSIKGRDIANELNCSAPIDGDSLEFDEATCTRMMGN